MDLNTFKNTLLHGERKTKILLWSSILCVIAGIGLGVAFAFTVMPAFIFGGVVALLAPFVILKGYRFSDPSDMKNEGVTKDAAGTPGNDVPMSPGTSGKPVDPIMAEILKDAGEVGNVRLSTKQSSQTQNKPIEFTPSKPVKPSKEKKEKEKPVKDNNDKPVKEKPVKAKKEKPAKPEKIKKVKEKKDVEKTDKTKPEKLKAKPKEDAPKPEKDKEKPEQNKNKPAKDGRTFAGKPEKPETVGTSGAEGAAVFQQRPEQIQREVREEKSEEPQKPTEAQYEPKSSNEVRQKTGEKSGDRPDKDSAPRTPERTGDDLEEDLQRQARNENNLIDVNKSELKKIMVKYKVKKEHRPVIIDSSERYKVEKCPAYLWVNRGKVHFLLMESTPREIVLDYHNATTVTYEIAAADPATEYTQIRTNMALSGIFGGCVPTYRENVDNRRRTSVKNLYVIGDDIRLTNTSARAAFDLLKADFDMSEKYMLPGLRGSFSKEAYKTKVLWQDGVINTSEFKTRTKNLLQRMTKAKISPLEYDNNLREMVYNQLITKEYADYYADAQE